MQISEQDIDNLCLSLKQTAIQKHITDAKKEIIEDISKNQLLQWGILLYKDGELLPTNAFALLTGYFQTKIHCELVRGTTRKVVFLDNIEFGGPIQKQVDMAYEYVLSKINLTVKIDGLYRQDIYEIPERALFHIIVNAVMHRDYLRPNNIQIVIYDNKIEINSPGLLVRNMTVEKMKEGYSRIRNKAIVNAFNYMGYSYEWGSGIPYVFNEYKQRKLKEPEIIEYDGDLRINLYRPNYNVTETKGDQEGIISSKYLNPI